jgi:energy-converting hydrogenase Eha subunit A
MSKAERHRLYWTVLITLIVMVLGLIQVKLLISVHFEAWQVHSDLQPDQTPARLVHNVSGWLPTPVSVLYGMVGLNVSADALHGRRRSMLVTLGCIAGLILIVFLTSPFGQDGSVTAVNDLPIVSTILLVLSVLTPIVFIAHIRKALRNPPDRTEPGYFSVD